MDPSDPIPLQEAVARGLIPCAICGASGAVIRQVGTRTHPLCARCAGRGRVWTWGLALALVAVAGLAGYLLLRRAPRPEDSLPRELHGKDPEHWTAETLQLMDEKRYAEARARIQDLLGAMPGRPDLNLLLGQCLMAVRAYDSAVPPLTVAYQSGAPYQDEAALWLGLSLKTMGRSREAAKYLEESSVAQKKMRTSLAEVYIDLERYEEARKYLPGSPDPGTLWARHRILVYQGKGEEAKKLLAGQDELEAWPLLAGQLREEGDFAGAGRVLSRLLAKVPPGSSAWRRAKRSELSLAVESGDLARMDSVIVEMSKDSDPELRGEVVFARALSQLLVGHHDQARATAWEFLAKTDAEFSPMRLERMMMRHLAGELKDADLEAEAKRVSRFHANDLLWYLALATGDRAWAEKALASTPGHNYPYHSIRRLLTK